MLFVLTVGPLVLILVLCVRAMIKHGKRADAFADKVNGMGNLIGKTYNEINAVLGASAVEETTSDGLLSVEWSKANGLGKQAVLDCIFDKDGKCVDFSKSLIDLNKR